MSGSHSRRLTQEVEDTYRRASIGGPFYLVAWLMVGWYGGAFQRAPLASLALLLIFLGLSVLRVLRRPPQKADDLALQAWLRWHWAIVVGTTTIWGLVFCWTLVDDGFSGARTAALVATVGLATAFAHTFTMRRLFALAGISAMYVPGLLLLLADPAHRATAMVMVVYLVYVLLSLVRSHADYQRGLDLDQTLRDQRDLFAELSRIDPLTGLANRRHFTDALTTAVDGALQGRNMVILLLLDLDHFKGVNDAHGHAAGDACLIAVAARMRANFSGLDGLVARLGGEEFGVLLQGITMVSSQAAAEAFRLDLASSPIMVDGIQLPVTVSIGLAQFRAADHRDKDGLYLAADRAVYRAKSAGRNRVCREDELLATA